MLFELIAAVVAGFAGAGVVMLANRILGGRLPRWFIPAGAGLAMLATSISNEYGWYPRTVEGLPEGMTVAQEVESRAVYRPWTYAVPFVNRFMAVDTVTMQRKDDQRIADVYLFARWSPPQKRVVAVDCAESRRADVTGEATIAEDGSLTGVTWRPVGGDDPIVLTACEG